MDLTGEFENEVLLKKPYIFLGKEYTSLNRLFIEMMKPKNYETALSDWELGKITDAIKKDKVASPSFDIVFDEILSFKKLEEFDNAKYIRSQLGLVNSFLNRDRGFILDGKEVTPDNLEKFIGYFFIKKKNNEGKESWVSSGITEFLKRILGNSELVYYLGELSTLIRRYSDILIEYQMLTGKSEQGLDKIIYNLDKSPLDKLEWTVNTYEELVKLAISKNLTLEKDRAVEVVSKFELKGSLEGIDRELKKFKKKYSSAKGDWALLYNQEELSDMEALLLLSAPINLLVINRRNRFLMLVGSMLMTLGAMIGLIVIPYFILKKLDKTNIRFTYRIGSVGEDTVTGVLTTTDGGFLIGGHTSGFGQGENDLWAIKVNKDFKVLWSKTIGGDYDDIANVMSLSQNRGFYLGGSTLSVGADDMNAIVVKFNDTGNRVWYRVYDMGGEDEILGLFELSRGGLAITGRYTTNSGKVGMFLSITKANGEPQWIKKFNDFPNGYGVAVVESPSQEIIALAKLEGDVSAMAFRENGELLWRRDYRNLDVSDQKLVLALDDGIVFAGESVDSVGGRSYVDVIKVDYVGKRLWNRRLAAQDIFRPLSFTTIQGGDNYLLMGESGDDEQNIKNNFYIFNDNGNYTLVEGSGKDSVRNSKWSVFKSGEIVLVGESSLSDKYHRDILMTKKKINLSLP